MQENHEGRKYGEKSENTKYDATIVPAVLIYPEHMNHFILQGVSG